ncbi:hypothetical protein Tco_1288349 [Tanacetum coccineum]
MVEVNCDIRGSSAVFVGSHLLLKILESPRDRHGEKALSEVRLPRVASSRRDAYRLKPQSDNNGSGVIILDKHVNGSVRLRGENLERKRDKGDLVVMPHHPSIGSVPRATEGEQVAAGWPPWLAAVAGEAINGWVPRRADSFEKLDKIILYVRTWFLEVNCYLSHCLEMHLERNSSDKLDNAVLTK